MKEALWISIGAILGANARYFIGGILVKAWGSAFPFHTLLINVTGCAVLGFFSAWAAERIGLDPALRLVIAAGFCGSYTTFSAFAYETVVLIQNGHWLEFALNVVWSNTLCLLAAMLGARLAR